MWIANIIVIIAFLFVIWRLGYNANMVIKKKNDQISRFKSYYNILNHWLMIKQEGINIAEELDRRGYKNIAIYGMGEVGNRLFSELKGTEINIKYCLDKNAASRFYDTNIIYPNLDKYEKVDCMIITIPFAMENIVKDIDSKCDFPLISISDIIMEL